MGAAAQINQWVTICHASTGKLAAKVKVSKDEVSGFVFSSRTGELIRSSWCNEIEIIDPVTGKLKEPLRPAANTHMVKCIRFTSDERKLVAVWSAQDTPTKRNCTIWSWPDRVTLTEFDIFEENVSDLAVSPDGQVCAISFGSYYSKKKSEGVHFVDLSSGKILITVSQETPWKLAFTPREGILIAPSKATSDDINCSFIEPKNGTTIAKMAIPGGVCELSVSNDGKYLAAATAFGGAMVWNLAPIISGASSKHT